MGSSLLVRNMRAVLSYSGYEACGRVSQERCSLKLTALTLVVWDGFMQGTRTPRELARERTMAEIMRLGREQLASQGAAALSLRAVAKDLGIVSSAVYRYVSSRDELLTLLVVEAYTELGDAVDAALEAPAGVAR